MAHGARAGRPGLGGDGVAADPPAPVDHPGARGCGDAPRSGRDRRAGDRRGRLRRRRRRLRVRRNAGGARGPRIGRRRRRRRVRADAARDGCGAARLARRDHRLGAVRGSLRECDSRGGRANRSRGRALRSARRRLACARRASSSASEGVRDVGIEDTALLQTLARIGAQAFERSRLFDDEQRLRRRDGPRAADDRGPVRLAHAAGRGRGRRGCPGPGRGRRRCGVLGRAWRTGTSRRSSPGAGTSPRRRRTGSRSRSTRPHPGNRALATRSLVFYDEARGAGGRLPARPRTAWSSRVTSRSSSSRSSSGGRTNGLVVTSFAEPVALDDEDRAFMETLASQAAQALDRARSFESERTIAETLQRSVLPVSLPRIPSVQLAARYLPGTDEVDVGGDWFDAILLPTGRLGLAVGDVVGKGVQSAATMAQLRNALRAFALDQMKPSSTISRLNRLTEEISESAFATVLYAVLDPETGVCRFTSAGHPPPLVVLPDGRASYVEGGRGLPLGTGTNVRYRQETLTLPVGSTLVFYTDGLVERRTESIDAGLERLRLRRRGSAGRPGAARRARPRDRGRERRPPRRHRRARGPAPGCRAEAARARPAERPALARPRPGRTPRLARAGTRDGDRVARHRARHLGSVRERRRAPAGRERARRRSRSAPSSRTRRCSSRSPTRAAGSTETERPDRGLGLHLIRSVMSSVEIDSGESGTRVRLEKLLTGQRVPAG